MNRPVLVFDGDCGFCSTSVRLLRRWVDRKGRYSVEPWQQVDLNALGLTQAQCVEAVQFVGADGSVTAGHRAVAEALRHAAPGWRPLGRLLTAPGVDRLAAHLYAWVATHRYELPGGTPACAVPAKPRPHRLSFGLGPAGGAP